MNYCIVIQSFSGIGGAQLYALRRQRHLVSKGINVYFVIGKNDELHFSKELEAIPHIVLSEIRIPAFDASNMDKLKAVNIFLEFLKGKPIECIESLDPYGATWAELFAKETKSKHIVYSLVEPVLYKNIQDRPMFNFFKFKLKQQQFIGLSSKSLEIIFNRKFPPDENVYVNIAFDEDELSETSIPDISSLSDSQTFVIATISRLEKSYISFFIDSVVEIAKKFPHRNFTVLIAGDSTVLGLKTNLIESAEVKTNKLVNLKILFLGYIKPIGKDFFSGIDLFVGMGTAAVSSISQSCPTLVVDPMNDLSSGVLGLDTNNFAYSESGVQKTIANDIERLIDNEELLKSARLSGHKLYNKQYRHDVCMKRLDNFIFNNLDQKVYYKELMYVSCLTKFIRYVYLRRNSGLIGYINQLKHQIFAKFRANFIKSNGSRQLKGL